jgi:hypothetical protein
VQGSVYLRRDKMALYQKSSGGHFNTGWLNFDLDADPLAPSVAQFQTVERQDCGSDLTVLASGTLALQAIWLPAGTPISTITFVSGATAAGTPLNQWFALYDSSLAKLAVTADETTTAWAASTAKTLTVSSGPFTTTYTGLHYLGIMVKATTVPSVAAAATLASLNGLSPKLAGSSSTGLTTPASAPSTAAAITAFAATLYSYVA